MGSWPWPLIPLKMLSSGAWGCLFATMSTLHFTWNPLKPSPPGQSLSLRSADVRQNSSLSGPYWPQSWGLLISVMFKEMVYKPRQSLSDKTLPLSSPTLNETTTYGMPGMLRRIFPWTISLEPQNIYWYSYSSHFLREQTEAERG